MASGSLQVNVTTSWVTTSSAEFFWYRYGTSACPTTFANFGVLPNNTATPACEPSQIYSSLFVGNTSLFGCDGELAYKTCMPTPSLASRFTAQVEGECDKTFTFHSPAPACPTGWTVGGQFVLTMTPVSHRAESETLTYPSMATERPEVPQGRYPELAGTHRLCCPSSYNLIGGDSYSCQRTGYAPMYYYGNDTSCGMSCNNSLYNCAPITRSFRLADVWPGAALTYAVEPLYLIGDDPSRPGSSMSRQQRIDRAIIISICTIAGAIAVVIALVVMRRRYRRRIEQEKKKASRQPVKNSWNQMREMQSNQYQMHDTPSSRITTLQQAASIVARPARTTSSDSDAENESGRLDRLERPWGLDTPWGERTLRVSAESESQREARLEQRWPFNATMMPRTARGESQGGASNPTGHARSDRPSFDLPPAYDSPAVWDGDGRPPHYQRM